MYLARSTTAASGRYWLLLKHMMQIYHNEAKRVFNMHWQLTGSQLSPQHDQIEYWLKVNSRFETICDGITPAAEPRPQTYFWHILASQNANASGWEKKCDFFAFWTPHFFVLTPHFVLTWSRLNYTLAKTLAATYCGPHCKTWLHIHTDTLKTIPTFAIAAG